MGDDANYYISQWIKNGMQEPRLKRKPIPRIQCQHCEKICVGQSGLMQHSNKKHDAKHSMHDILMLSSKERFEQII